MTIAVPHQLGDQISGLTDQLSETLSDVTHAASNVADATMRRARRTVRHARKNVDHARASASSVRGGRSKGWIVPVLLVVVLVAVARGRRGSRGFAPSGARVGEGTATNTTTKERFDEMTNHKADDLKGRVKEAVGDLTDDERLQREGQRDQAGAAVKEKVDKARDKINDGVDAIKEKMDRH